VRMQRSLIILYRRFQVDIPGPAPVGRGVSSKAERSRRHKASREA
jgi:hypothetical protein